MRNLILIFAFLCVFVFGSVFSDMMIEKHFAAFKEKVENISTEEELEEITKDWEKLSDFLEIIVDHGDLEEVSQQLWAMKEEIKYDYDEFMESKTTVMEMLLHIRDRNTLGIVNIL